jgi:hypothetical protein
VAVQRLALPTNHQGVCGTELGMDTDLEHPASVGGDSHPTPPRTALEPVHTPENQSKRTQNAFGY